MSKRPIPWAIGVISLLYWGMLIYWRRGALRCDQYPSRDPIRCCDRKLWFGFILSFVHVGYVMACFMVEMPEPLKEVPVIGKFGKMLGWMLMVLLVVWYTRPRLFDGWEAGNLDAHGYLFVGVILLGFGTGTPH